MKPLKASCVKRPLSTGLLIYMAREEARIYRQGFRIFQDRSPQSYCIQRIRLSLRAVKGHRDRPCGIAFTTQYHPRPDVGKAWEVQGSAVVLSGIEYTSGKAICWSSAALTRVLAGWASWPARPETLLENVVGLSYPRTRSGWSLFKGDLSSLSGIAAIGRITAWLTRKMSGRLIYQVRMPTTGGSDSLT